MEYKPSKMEVEEPIALETSQKSPKPKKIKSLIELISKEVFIDQIEDMDTAETKLLLTDYLPKLSKNNKDILKAKLIKKYPQYWKIPAPLTIEVKCPNSINSASFNPESTQVVTALDDKTAKVWYAKTGKLLLTLKHNRWVTSAHFNSAGTKIVTSSRDGTAKVWNAYSEQPLLTLQHKDQVMYAQFNHAGTQIVTITITGDIIFWDAELGKELFGLHQKPIINFAEFNPNDTQIVTASMENARVWDIQTRKELFAMDHDETVYYAEFNKAGTQIVTASGDHTAKIWDAKSGKLIHTLRCPKQVFSAKFNSSGTQVVTASDSIGIWDVKSGLPVSILKETFSHWAEFNSTTNYKILSFTSYNFYIWELPSEIFNKLSLEEILILMKMKQYGNEILADRFYKEQWEDLFNKLNNNEKWVVQITYNKPYKYPIEEMEEE